MSPALHLPLNPAEFISVVGRDGSLNVIALYVR
jgi:hypothetical protein